MSKGISRRLVAQRLGWAAGSALLASGGARAAVPTPKQVEGPFHPLEAQADTDPDLSMIEGRSSPAQGEIILVQGRVLDTDGAPLAGALVDVWQANHHGRYSHPDDPNPAPLDPNFQGWGLLRTDSAGRYAFKTIKPGAYPLRHLGGEGWRCRHIHFQVAAPGAARLTTQMYFDGDPLIAQDEEIAKAPADLRPLLIATATPDAATGLPLYRFDLVLKRLP